ncbi:inner membrane transporter RhtA [Arthrobacter alpinus]|uniref:Inner membrane transporter RhtA n=2 Tax=Arthrobacter alpinus TaxID=656366 RepID=A0A1H5MA92_9MICC|nr:inner membrane transporter RhtA [Arthrobacter alpinus]
MSGSGSRLKAVPPWTLAVAAMLSVQLSSALSVSLFPAVGTSGAAWLRLTAGALFFALLCRPNIRKVRRADLPLILGLGVTTGMMTILFLAALSRIPLGTAVAIEFLGPLTVAAIRSHRRRAMVWPALALAGVVLLTEPWLGSIDLLGIGFAALAAGCWGIYILLTQRLGDRFSGIQGLALTAPIAAVVAAIFGIPQAIGNLSWTVILASIGLAILMPVIPFTFELLALRKMTHTAFGTLMALEPAFGVLLGLILLHQRPTIVQAFGVALVVVAGTAAQRNGRRRPSTRTKERSAPQPELIP